MDLGNFCSGASSIVQVAGWVLLVFRIAIPLIIVILGAFDLGKAVTGSKDDDIKKSAKTLAIRIVAGICIYLVPALVLWIFSLVAGFKSASTAVDFEVCKTCLLTPNDCNTGEE